MPESGLDETGPEVGVTRRNGDGEIVAAPAPELFHVETGAEACVRARKLR